MITGDIAFRFLEYVHQQQQRRRRKEDVGSWSDVTDIYSSGPEALGSGLPGQSRAVVCDINQEMLKVGRERAESLDLRAGEILGEKERAIERVSPTSFPPPPGLSWVVGDAEELPFNDDQFDFYTIAFGIRNVTHMDQVSDIWWRVRLGLGRARVDQVMVRL